jgi:hypothetical protein
MLRHAQSHLVGGGYTISVAWCRDHIHQQHVLPCPPSTYSRTLVASSRVSPAPTIKHVTSEYMLRGREPSDGREMLRSGMGMREVAMATQRAPAGPLSPRAHGFPGKADAHTRILASNPCGWRGVAHPCAGEGCRTSTDNQSRGSPLPAHGGVARARLTAPRADRCAGRWWLPG